VINILVRIHSILELELLLLVHEVPDQEWRPDALAKLVDLETLRIRGALVNLSRSGLLERLYGGQSSCFRFNSASANAQAVDELAAQYVRSRARLVGFIEARARSPLRDFSESFRMREDSDR
jgi:hypothetical protein